MSYRPWYILLIIGALLLVGRGWQSTIQLVSLIQLATEPALAAESGAARKTINFTAVIASLGDLARENAELRSRNIELEAQLVGLKEVEHENAILRQELSFVKEGGKDYLPAQLIGRSATGLHKDLILNRGRRDGLRLGQAVVAQGFLVGVINHVQESQSTVLLINHPRSLVPALLQDSRSTGLLRGGISGLSLTDILIDAPVQIGETVLTSGLGGELPVGIPIGKVVSLESKKGDITKKAAIVSPNDSSKLELVFIRKDKP